MSSPNLSTDAAAPRDTGPNGLKPLMGRSRAIEELSLAIEQIAKTDYTVIIQGETGTGKEVVARQIHHRSKRRAMPFLGVDCGAMSGSLFESELFGHEKGAFTGADSKVPGLLAVAGGGTLLLDEITGLTPEMQRKFLRALEEKAFLPVGGKKPVPLKGRLLVASNVNLEEEVRKENFRADLYHRLSEFIIKIPALRERKEDVPHLANRFREKTNAELNKEIEGFSEEAMDTLLAYPFPGNVRELRNIVRRAMLLAKGVIGPDHLTFMNGKNSSGGDNGHMDIASWLEEGLGLTEMSQRIVEQVEREAIQTALNLANNNRSRAARVLQINRKTFYRKMKGCGFPRSNGGMEHPLRGPDV